jgi:ferredoxin-type protein NapH
MWVFDWKKKRLRYLRRLVQLSFLILILYGGYLGITSSNKTQLGSSEEDLKAAELNANLKKDPRIAYFLPIHSCKNTDKDYGAFQGCSMFMFNEMITYGAFLGLAIPALLVFISAFLFGRTWCGWACPVGFIQDMQDAIRSTLRISYVTLSRSVNRFLRQFRLWWLAMLFIVAFAITLPIFAVIRKDLHNLSCLTCPTRYVLWFFPNFSPTFMSFKTSFYSIGSVILILFIGIVIASFLIRRFWCRICPNGTFLALFNKGSLMTKEKDIQKCTKCGICYNVCPMDNEDVYTVKHRKVVNSKNCVMCFECVEKCPETDCLKVKFAGKTLIRSKFK